jgi:hypothetical protein
MKIYIAIANEGEVIFRIVAEQNGDLFESVITVTPGQKMLGYKFEELRALGVGVHDIEDRT